MKTEPDAFPFPNSSAGTREKLTELKLRYTQFTKLLIVALLEVTWEVSCDTDKEKFEAVVFARARIKS